MTKKRKGTTGGGKNQKLKLKKETIKDLDASKRGREVKGGRVPRSEPGDLCSPVSLSLCPNC